MFWNDDRVLRFDRPPGGAAHAVLGKGVLINLIGVEGSNILQVVLVRSASGLRPSGLRWASVGSTRPATGKELTNDKLANALSTVRFHQRFHQDRHARRGYHSHRFTEKEWNGFSIKDLHVSNFIKSGGTYFKPISSNIDSRIELSVNEIEDTFTICEDRVHTVTL